MYSIPCLFQVITVAQEQAAVTDDETWNHVLNLEEKIDEMTDGITDAERRGQQGNSPLKCPNTRSLPQL